jgi:hypothetical protein
MQRQAELCRRVMAHTQSLQPIIGAMVSSLKSEIRFNTLGFSRGVDACHQSSESARSSRHAEKCCPGILTNAKYSREEAPGR